MVASQEDTATRVGVDILKQGGNAVDAAVAVGFALAVTHPAAGNLGGGGFMLIHWADRGETVALDFRETAPAAAHADMFLDETGAVDEFAARHSHRSVGVPGTVAGLAEALKKFGTLPLEKILAPAIRLAGEGMAVNSNHVVTMTRNLEKLRRWPETARIFLKPDGSVHRRGDRLVQNDLADSLRHIARQGPRAFYEGAIAEKLVAEMKAHGGKITREDLRTYRPVWRPPVRGTYRGYEIASMPPPSSGGVHLIQMLNILEGFPLAQMGANSAETLHHLAEAMKLAFADRSRHLGDPDFWEVPVRGLISKSYADALRHTIDPDRARPSSDIQPGNPRAYERKEGETTHFSVMDRFGNAVAATVTLNLSYGTGIVAQGTGILLNDEMDDFSAKPGVPNAFGLIGGEANAIEPGKRPLSSMTPTLVFKDGRPFLATGSPGGPRIITAVLQTILNVIDHHMNVAEAAHAPRIHHQWLPDELRVEAGLNPDTRRGLRTRGHRLVIQNSMGSTQSILRTPEGFFGASDPRRLNARALGY